MKSYTELIASLRKNDFDNSRIVMNNRIHKFVIYKNTNKELIIADYRSNSEVPLNKVTVECLAIGVVCNSYLDKSLHNMVIDEMVKHILSEVRKFLLTHA